MDNLVNIDKDLFHFFNSSDANPVFDFLMPVITNNTYWLPIYAILFIWLLWKGGKKGRIAALVLIITIILSDQICSSLIKDYVGRLRPCRTLEYVRLLVGCGVGKSFPSSHAANNFAAAFVLTHYYRKYWYIFYSIAALIAFSRVYVGVHYPSDIIGGAIIGVIIAYLVVKGEEMFMIYLERKKIWKANN